MDSDLSLAAYREAVTGTPAGIGVMVTGTDGSKYAFDGLEDGIPVHVIADYRTHFTTDRKTATETELAFERLAQKQLSITSPVVWLVQHEADALQLQGQLNRPGIDQLQIIYRRPATEPAQQLDLL